METNQISSPEFIQQLIANLDLTIKDAQDPNKEIKTDSSSDEEETIDVKAKATSPSKYYGKRVSFDYHNLKKIEKPIIRRASVFDTIKESNISMEKEINIVKFDEKTEEIKSEEIDKSIDNPLKNENLKKKPQKKSILKNTCFSEELDLDKIFTDKQFYKELIDKVKEECGQIQELIRDKLHNLFNLFMIRKLNEGSKITIAVLLKVFHESLIIYQENYYYRE